MIKKKICLVGSFAVGKTSLVRRFVTGIFSDDYLTTVGVKIDKKTMIVGNQEVRLMIWDIAGRDDLQAIQKNYLRGASGFFFVADGTRRETVDEVLEEIEAIESENPGVPCLLMLLNKADLSSDWEMDDTAVRELRTRFPVYVTSAKTGEHVEEAFEELTRQMLGLGSAAE